MSKHRTDLVEPDEVTLRPIEILRNNLIDETDDKNGTRVNLFNMVMLVPLLFTFSLMTGLLGTYPGMKGWGHLFLATWTCVSIVMVLVNAFMNHASSRLPVLVGLWLTSAVVAMLLFFGTTDAARGAKFWLLCLMAGFLISVSAIVLTTWRRNPPPGEPFLEQNLSDVHVGFFGTLKHNILPETDDKNGTRVNLFNMVMLVPLLFTFSQIGGLLHAHPGMKGWGHLFLITLIGIAVIPVVILIKDRQYSGRGKTFIGVVLWLIIATVVVFWLFSLTDMGVLTYIWFLLMLVVFVLSALSVVLTTWRRNPAPGEPFQEQNLDDVRAMIADEMNAERVS